MSTVDEPKHKQSVKKELNDKQGKIRINRRASI